MKTKKAKKTEAPKKSKNELEVSDMKTVKAGYKTSGGPSNCSLTLSAGGGDYK